MSCCSLWLYYNDAKTEILWSFRVRSFLLKYSSSLLSIPLGLTTPQVDCEGFDQGGDVAHRSLPKSLAVEPVSFPG